MKRKYETPLCEAHRLETAGELLAASETRNLTVDHTPSDTFIKGDVNSNNGWTLW